MTNGQLESNVRVKAEYDDDPHIFTVKHDDDFTIITQKDDVLEMCPHCEKAFYRPREGLAIVNLKKHNQHFMVKREKGRGLIIFAVTDLRV